MRQRCWATWQQGGISRCCLPDTKELLGLDQYQVMSAIRTGARFWTLVLGSLCFLEEQRAVLEQALAAFCSIGQTQQEVQRHWPFHLIT